MPHALVVEDDLATQTLYCALLRMCGVDCTVASDGEGALAALRRGEFDLVILDLVMPKLSGLDLLRELESASHGVLSRVVVCTAMSPQTLSLAGELRHVRRVLYKPVDIDIFAAEILASTGERHARGGPFRH